MSLVFNGATTARVYGSTNLPTSTGAATHLACYKRLGRQTGQRILVRWSKSGDSHSLMLGGPQVDNTYSPWMQANIASALSDAIGFSYEQAWIWMALVGDGTNLTAYVREVGVDTWTSATITQTAFAPTLLEISGISGGTENAIQKVSYTRIWNTKLTPVELLADSKSATVVRTANLLHDKSFMQSLMVDSLLGTTGATFSTGIGVSIDTDGPVFGPTILGFGSMSAAAEEIALTLSTPNVPVVTVVNSDTVSINVTGVDPVAETLLIYGKPATASSYSIVGTVAVGSLPAVITGLNTGTSYNFTAVATREGANSSAASPVATAPTKTLYVDGYIKELSNSLGVTGVAVQIWRLPVGGSDLVGEDLGFFTGQSFEGSSVVVGSDTVARLRVALPNQPATGAKLRDGANVCLVARKITTGNELWSEVKNDAVVKEI